LLIEICKHILQHPWFARLVTSPKPPNAPRQPRRWQRCVARRVTAREDCQSRAQVKGRASGVVLHAVVGLRKAFNC